MFRGFSLIIYKMQNQLKQIQTLIQQKKFTESAEAARKLINSSERNLGAMLFLAQALIQLNELAEAQNVINDIYSKIRKGTDEDALFYNTLMTQETLAIQLQTNSNSAQMRKQGRQIHLTNKFQIIEFLDRKKKFDKMIEESDTYCLLLLEDGRYKEVEETYLWLMNHLGLSNEVRASYGLRIQEIDPFYKPFTRLDSLLAQVSKITPGASNLTSLGVRILENLDNQNCKKNLFAVIQSENPQVQKDFNDFCQQLLMVGEIVYKDPSQIFVDTTRVRMFIRYVGASFLHLQFLSPAWNEKISVLSRLYESQAFKSVKESDHKQQVKLLLLSLIDTTQVVTKAKFPEFTELLIAQIGTLGDIQALLSIQNSEITEVTPLVSAYLAICTTSKNCPFESDPKSTLAKIKQSQFLWNKMTQIKLCKAHESQDFNIFMDCLRLSLKTDKVVVDQNFKLAEENFQNFKSKTSSQIQNLYLSMTTELKWQNYLNCGDWIQAIKCLDQLGVFHPEKAVFVSTKKCAIQLQHLEEICENQEQKDIQVQAIFNTLQSDPDSESLFLQGYIIFQNLELFGSDEKAALNKWLLALKKDQTNPDIFYSLAVYYFGIKDLKRATGCLDKALKLRGGFELALVLAYHLIPDQDQRLALVDRFMEVNRSCAVSYFFKGLIMQQKQDFVTAIDMFQNAMKFYTISRQRSQVPSLLPKVALAIYENPFGIFGHKNASICWVYLSECFFKIEKPSVALKCFTQAIQEMSIQNTEVQKPISAEVSELLEIIKYEKLHPSHLEAKNDQIMKLLSDLKPQKWALECLVLGSKFVTTPQQSIAILDMALKCLPSENVPTNLLAFILTELIDKITSLIKAGVVIEDGQAKLYTECNEMISCLHRLVDFCIARSEFDQNHNLQKKILNAYFVIAQRTQDKASYLKAIERSDILMISFEKTQFKRAFLLDACKIIHEYQRFDSSEQLQKKKMTLVRQAIMQEPLQANLWVHLSLFSTEQAVQAKAIFKAYELEPENIFVQEHMLRFYFKTRQWRKAFKILVRSYQQSTTDNVPQQPIVIATLAYFNAMCYLEFGKKEQLFEALSLIKMVQREDFVTLLNELQFYLKHFSGDYITTINYLQRNQTEENKVLLVQAYLGTSVMTLSEAQERTSLIKFSHELLQSIYDADSFPNDVLQLNCEQNIAKFLKAPSQTATALALYQEICLVKGVLPANNVLDSNKIQQCLQEISPSMQRIIMIQALRLIQLRDGKIPEAEKIIKPDGTYEEVKIDRSYTSFIVEMSRFKPQHLSAAQHRALFRLFINTQIDNSHLQGIFNNDRSQIKDQFQALGLNLVLGYKKDEEDNGQTLLMKNPLSIEGNTKWIWSLLRAGKLEQAIKGHQLVKQNNKLGIMTGNQEQFQKLDEFITSLNTKVPSVSQSDDLGLISQLIANLRGSKDFQREDSRIIAAKIVHLVQKLRDSDQSKAIDFVCKTIELMLFDQGHFGIYCKILKELLNFANVAKITAESVNIIWHYQLLSTASTMIETRKLTQISALCKEGMLLCQNGFQKRSSFPVTLLQSRMHLSLNNHKQLIDILNVDEAVLERDFIIALSLYAQQEYKEYYLMSMALVAGAKASQTTSWQLAYAYYLKAFAEMTFLTARKLGLTLKVDFDASEGDYNIDYFSRKAKSSINKCKQALIISSITQSLLIEAIEAIESQIYEH